MSERSATDDGDRMGAGTAVLSCVFALVIGGVAGLVATFARGGSAPWLLVAGFAIEVALVAGFRLVFASRLVGAAAAVGFLVGCALLAFPGAGAPVLVLDGPSGWIWTVGVVVLAVAALVPPWPWRAPERP